MDSSKYKDPIWIENYHIIDERVDKLYDILRECWLCPRKCGVNRLKGEKGYCRSGKELMVSSATPHFGEEDVLVGSGGSGTIFLTNCNLRCIFCQNYDITHLGRGKIVEIQEFADLMIYLQRIGTHNINFVTPTHYTPFIIDSLRVAYKKGLRLPLVYNCSGYENVEVIKLLDGLIDIYMPDFKYGENSYAKRYSNVDDYFERACESLKEMHRQVGDLYVENGIAYRGLLIRHLVMPNNTASSEKVLQFIANELSKDSYVNIMAQYRPCYLSRNFKEINRRISLSEYNEVVDKAYELGLHRGFGKMRPLFIF